MKTCVIDGCGKPLLARGWCHAHYKKWQLHGDPSHGKTYERARGQGTVNHAGYIAVMVGDKKRLQHSLVIESELGYSIPAGFVVHHRDRNRQNNNIENLVLCDSQARHKELHLQDDATDAGFPPHFRKCIHCRAYDDPSSMTKTGNNVSGHRHYHKPCRTKAEYERTHK